jgi:hypothetical protein
MTTNLRKVVASLLGFAIGEESRRPRLAPLATHRAHGRLAQRAEAGDFAEQVGKPARHGWP